MSDRSSHTVPTPINLFVEDIFSSCVGWLQEASGRGLPCIQGQAELQSEFQAGGVGVGEGRKRKVRERGAMGRVKALA